MSKQKPGNKLSRREMLQNTFNLFAEQMDRRDAFFFRLKEFHDAHGYVPAEYVAPWLVWTEQDKCRPWREIPGTTARLWKAARIQVRNGYAKAAATFAAARAHKSLQKESEISLDSIEALR